VIGDRLDPEDVERRARDLAAVERVLEVLVDDQRAARDVEDPHPVAHLRERRGVQPAVRLGRVGQVDRDEVGLCVEVVGAVALLDAEVRVALRRHIRVVGDDAHPEALRAHRDKLSDAPEPDHAERLVHQLGAVEERAIPAARRQRAVRLRDVSREREQQRHRVLGGGDDVRARRVGDDDAALRGRRDVDVVDAHAGAGDHAQPRRVADQLGVDLRRRADQDAVVVADLRDQLLARPADPEVDVQAGHLQQVHAGLADRFGDEHALGHQSPVRSTTQSTQAVSARTSAGSIAGNIATRSWLRPSLR
jgi:hypothetical protein